MNRISTRITRRAFVKASAAAVSSVALPVIAQASTGSPIGVAVIGCGVYGLQAIRELKTDTRLEVGAVADVYGPRRELAQAIAEGAPGFARWESALQEDVQAVVVATPDHTHAHIALEALDAGLDVYMAPPLCRTVDEADRLERAVAKASAVMHVGAPEAVQPQWEVAARWIREDRIGRVRYVQVNYSPGESLAAHKPNPAGAEISRARLDWQAFLGPETSHAFDPHRYLHWRSYWDYAAGPITDQLFCRLAAVLKMLELDLPSRVSVAGGIYATHRETPDSFVMSAEYPEGPRIVVSTASATRSGAPVMVRGTRGSIACHATHVELVSDTCAPSIIERVPVAHATPLARWAQCLETRESAGLGVADGRKAVAAISMAMTAYRERRTMVSSIHG